MNKFFEYFNIPKIEYREPGRVVDDEGELAEWYIDYDYPSVEPVFMDLLHYYYGNLHGNRLFISGAIEPYILCNTLSEAILGLFLDAEEKGLDMSEEKEEVREIFTDFYGGEEE